MNAQRLLIVGDRGGTNVGQALENAAVGLGIEAKLVQSRLAMEAPAWVRRANWWLRGKRPTKLSQFSSLIVDECRRWRPDTVLATGIAPITKRALLDIGEMGIRRVDYLTDDPWNAAHRAPWFLEALPHYDRVFSPRVANIPDLIRHGCSEVTYLPFAYAPELHYPDPPKSEADRAMFDADVIFAGGAEAARVATIERLIRSGFNIALYGDHWNRFSGTKASDRGHANPVTLRQATTVAKTALCLVRHANRDGNVMRTFEIAAMGACMLVEDTVEHRNILGTDGEAVLYFRTADQMVDRLRWLLAHDEERVRLGATVRTRITNGGNTYGHRLQTMLAVTGTAPRS